MFNTVIYICFSVLFLYCLFSVLYLLVLSLSGKYLYPRRRPAQRVNDHINKIAVLVPAYKEDGIILSTATHLLRLDYPADAFDIYLIADSFQQETLTRLRQLPVQVLEVAFDSSTKTKSLNEAFSRITKPYDIALICDADNILTTNFLQKINNAFNSGYKAVQGRRVAKNLDTSFAILDACSEGINNHIFRKGANGLGLSASVIGSGMAFDYGMVKQLLSHIQAVGGFDKILQLQVVQQQHNIIYLSDALIFDEKVASSQAFKQQRKRWLSSQFIYLKQFFRPAVQALFHGNTSYFMLAIVNNLVLPRSFLLVMLPLLVIAGFCLSVLWGMAAAILWLLYIVTLLIAVPAELVNKDLGQALLRLPKAILLMLGTLFHLKKANKTFIHTVHTKTEVSNNILNEYSQ